MKTPSKFLVLASSLVIAVLALLPHTSHSQQTPAAPAPVAAAVEQYKVLDLSRYNNLVQLEADLNKLGADGWKVRVSTPGSLILSRQG